jgi:hypothetical protein
MLPGAVQRGKRMVSLRLFLRPKEGLASPGSPRFEEESVLA